ncbi:hypothetical protein QBC46DRAFT_373141 [Diplogelasinospora grovesii]|uniref:Uncharacterized protein n=1 Tax=Diplogelasinospora grovesii TaxID=303347 RepID=A0AAN6S9H4_9PEZI|nr:hypothetical protein QBC46DRAFT_373141 [Diplogelasinospora grovesii]
MVAGKGVLHSVAVLLSLGLETVLGGRLIPRDNQTYAPLQSVTDIATSTPSLAGAVPPPIGPIKKPPPIPTISTVAVTASSGDTFTLNAGTTDGVGTFGTLQSATESATATPSLAGAVPPPIGPVKLTQSAATVQSASFDLGQTDPQTDAGGNSDATTPALVVSSSDLRATASGSSQTEYPYPPEVGMSGLSLTTDTNAPTRTVTPTRNSISPNSGSVIKPPPIDTWVPTPPVIPPPILPTLSVSLPTVGGGGVTYGPGNGGSTATATAPLATKAPPAFGPPPKFTTVQITASSSDSFDFGYGTDTTDTTATITSSSTDPLWLSTRTATTGGNQTTSRGWNATTLSTSTYPNASSWTMTVSSPPDTSVSYCQASDLTSLLPTAVTSWSIVYTSTITWYGNPSDYTEPYPPITTPTIATPAATTTSCVWPKSPGRLTISVCSATGTGSKYVTCSVTTSTATIGFGSQTSTIAGVPYPFSPTPTVVFLTTDKNPTVVYSTIQTPNYGVSAEPITRDQHNSAQDSPSATTSPPPGYGSQGNQGNSQGAASDGGSGGQGQHTTPNGPVTVAVQPSAVVINGNTISDNPTAPTQIVVVSGQTFTIDPTKVVGAGATVDRPSVTGGIFVPTPTTTTLGGLPVTVSSSIAVIAGSSFTINPSTPTTVMVSGQTVVIGPSGVTISSQTLSLTTLPSPTEIVVAGGDLVTAIGQSVVVIQGTTITYSSFSSSPSSTVIDGDTVVYGPGGVTVHGTTLGGTTAKSTETAFAIVGGATITEIGPSVVVISGTSYTVGPSAPGGTQQTTITVGGETITIGPSGVAISTSITFAYPFGPTTTITPSAGDTASAGTAGTATATKDAATQSRPGLDNMILAILSVVLSIIFL